MSYGSRAAERLSGKTILITGASSGIGQATAYELAAASNGSIKLILAARRLDRLVAAKKELESKFSIIKVFPLQLDISDYKSIKGTLANIPDEFGDVDVLINNA
jgi:3-hydroxy acid dehydrogenase/malonic semialdehyde reductase